MVTKLNNRGDKRKKEGNATGKAAKIVPLSLFVAKLDAAISRIGRKNVPPRQSESPWP